MAKANEADNHMVGKIDEKYLGLPLIGLNLFPLIKELAAEVQRVSTLTFESSYQRATVIHGKNMTAAMCRDMMPDRDNQVESVVIIANLGHREIVIRYHDRATGTPKKFIVNGGEFHYLSDRVVSNPRIIRSPEDDVNSLILLSKHEVVIPHSLTVPA